MSQETLLMEWTQLRELLMECNVMQQEDAWNMMKEHEKHMEQKGYEFKMNRVISPNGETIWES